MVSSVLQVKTRLRKWSFCLVSSVVFFASTAMQGFASERIDYAIPPKSRAVALDVKLACPSALPPGASIDGNVLTVAVPLGSAEQGCLVSIPLDPAVFTKWPFMLEMDVWSEDVSPKPNPWNGVKMMLQAESVLGEVLNPQAEFPTGTVSRTRTAVSFDFLGTLSERVSLAYTHQYVIGVTTQDVKEKGLKFKPKPYPNADWRNPDLSSTGRPFDKEYLRRAVRGAREFQLRHNARVYVGEFSVAAWAPGADRYLADCADIFAEYGWDWTYHAFREYEAWSVEHDFPLPPVFGGKSVPSRDNPRKRVLLEAFRKNCK